ncbi:hypothetical protein ACHAW5_010478 [Stephanodiscus triporus]|uniref:Uncharacterized protein n=1 Tax=Stephanodiscus triporus TaxID=2934178 RepID=A0ABD3NLK5_9STRA
MATMNLTPEHSTPWWSLFGCCHAPSESSPLDDEDHDGRWGEGYHDVFWAAPPPSSSLKVVTGDKVVAAGEEANRPETPSTACSTDNSAGTSLKAEDDDFAGEIAISTPKSKSNAFEFEDGDDFIGEVVFPTPKIGSDEKISRKRSVTFKDDDDDDDHDHDDYMSDPDEANYWYADLSNFDAARGAFDGKNVNSLTLNNAGSKFYQFAFLAMLMFCLNRGFCPANGMRQEQYAHPGVTLAMVRKGGSAKFEVIGLGFGGSFD